MQYIAILTSSANGKGEIMASPCNMLWVAAGVLLAFLLLLMLYLSVRRSFWVLFSHNRSLSNNPFREPCRKMLNADLVTDKAARDRVLKQRISEDKIPSNLDAIVIGSGIGGLSVAALLAKTGKKVLVLEQHDQAGGCCHTYLDKGFEFDIGIHYVGEMAEGTIYRLLIDELSDCGIEWAQLDEVYDTVVIGIGDNSAKPKRFPMPSGRDNLIDILLERFPSEEKAIRKFFGLLKRLRRAGMIMSVLKLLPGWFSRVIVRSGILKRLVPDVAYYTKSISQVLNELTDNQELKAVLAYSSGTYATLFPKEASFVMQASVINHISRGGHYPIGGPSEIAFNIIPVIEKAGGKVLVQARVTDILMNNDSTRVKGVCVKAGHTERLYEILAPLVISDAGLYNTFEDLLPANVVKQYGIDRTLGKVRHGAGVMLVFVGLKGTDEELGLKPSNVWAYQNADLDGTAEKYIRNFPMEKLPFPFLFISFPSAKDPMFTARHPGKSTCVIVTDTPYEWFEQWKDEKVMKRSEDYKALKMALGRQMWQHVCELFPQLEDKLEYLEVGTPLSNQYYLGSSRGEVCGIDHNMTRFTPEAILELRPEIGIPGLYLTGQDIMLCGFTGAMYGGVLCASTILKRNLMDDLFALKTKKEEKKEQ